MGAEPLPNRAGMIAFNRAGLVLICSSLTRKDLWVFPKGHIEPNEASYEAAERECVEETGIYAVVDGGSPLGTQSYQYAGENVITEFWCGLAVRLDPTKWQDINRETKWVPWQTALDMLSFCDLRNMLRAALCIDEVEVGSQAIIITDHREEVGNK